MSGSGYGIKTSSSKVDKDVEEILRNKPESQQSDVFCLSMFVQQKVFGGRDFRIHPVTTRVCAVAF